MSLTNGIYTNVYETNYNITNIYTTNLTTGAYTNVMITMSSPSIILKMTNMGSYTICHWMRIK